jgi:hypothetical protein
METWQSSSTNKIDYAVLAAAPGVLGFSGDIAGLPTVLQERLCQHISFYKRYRGLIYDSVGYLLTPVSDKNDSKRWIAFQLQSLPNNGSILFIYRLDDAQKVKIIKPCALNGKEHYKVEYWDGRKDIEQISGKKLMDDGITVEISEKFEAVSIILAQFVKDGGNP